MAGYKGGRILRIKVNDFMTYDEFKIFPKAGLNVIIGLNGSGKSSLMSAICLGLTGKPQSTGKSNQLKDFIKHGKDKAIIEIDLEDPVEDKVVIRRVIEGEKSTWFLNNKPATTFQVTQVVKKYNIDVNNMCQFLPQEKVSEFSKMDTKKRLENMIQAIGEPHLHTLFEDLKKEKKELGILEKDLAKLQSGKDIELQKNERLKAEVNKHEQRKKLQETLKDKQFQKLVIQYEKLQNGLRGQKEERKQILKELAVFKRDLERTMEGVTATQSELSNIQTQIRYSKSKTSEAVSKFTQLSNKFAEIHEEVDCAKVDFQNKIDEKQNQQARLADLDRMIKGLQSTVEQNIPEKKRLQDRSHQIAMEHERVREQISNLDSEIENINLQINRYGYESKSLTERLNRAKNEQNQQREFLKQRFRDTYEAVCWLEQNMSSFKARICFPALLSLKVHREEDRKFVENTISIRDMKTFICSNDDDVRRLTDVLITQMKLKVNIGRATGTSMADFPTPPITSELRRMGVESFLSDLITAPEPLMHYLCKLYKLHRIPICNAAAMHNIDLLLQTSGVAGLFYTPTERFQGKRSKYGNNNRSVKREYIRARNLIRSSREDSTQVRELNAKLQENQEQISNLELQAQNFQKQRSVFERQQEQLRLEKIQLIEQAKMIQNTELQLRQKTEMYKKKVSEVINEEEEKEKVTKKIHALNMKRMSMMSEMEKLLREFLDYKIQKTKHILYATNVQKKHLALKRKVQEKQNDKEALQRKYDEKNAEYDAQKGEATRLLSKIKEQPVDVLDHKKSLNKDASIMDLLKNKMSLKANIPSMEEIEQDIVRIEAQLALNFEDNDSVLQEYHEREKNISNYGTKIADLESKLNRMRTALEIKKQQWLPAINSHVTTINKKFSQYYQLLHCAGEICLDSGEDPDDFENYGLQIFLKYRDNEPFSLLSQDHHSGGECNVAAVIFILSLQELTRVPFRCVDEINQGMDSSNERKMYELIADDAIKNGSCSQYFLLTPKLLKDMTFHKDVAVHILFNSKYLNIKLNIQKHIRMVKMNCP